MRGASVYERQGRPVYYISFFDPTSYRRRHEATHFRIDDPAGKGKAYALALERSKLSRVHQGNEAEQWHAWVMPYINQRYRRKPLTIARFESSWLFLQRYFLETDIAGPRSVTFEHVRDFLDWRVRLVKRSGKSVCHNTAMTDVKILSALLAEAVRRGWITHNPCHDLGITKEPAKEKREISDEEMATIIQALDEIVAQRPHKDWMRISWEIARWQGCRLSETCFDIRKQVNFRDDTITFHGKGGKTIHTKLHPELRPYLEQMLQSGRTFTCRFPRMGAGAAGAASKFFRGFFDGLGLHDVSFHCTRVTVITKLIRAGVPVAQVMAFIGHADEEVNRIYQKLKPRDLGGVTAALCYKPTTAQTPRSPGGG